MFISSSTMGLVEYASSDEENDDERLQTKDGHIKGAKSDATIEPPAEAKHEPKEEEEEKPPSKQHHESQQAEKPIVGPSIPQGDNPIGPFLPSTAQSPHLQPEEEETPTSSNRALIHDLTLPSIPNLDIPPSPPGSPPPGANAKMEQFLSLKDKGIHFNAKLEHSAALKNPSLMDKLLAYVDIDEVGQYATTLPLDLWDAEALPEWAFRDRLRKTRERIAKEKEADRASGSRTSVEFVSSGSSSSAGLPVAGGLSSRHAERRDGWK